MSQTNSMIRAQILFQTRPAELDNRVSPAEEVKAAFVLALLSNLLVRGPTANGLLWQSCVRCNRSFLIVIVWRWAFSMLTQKLYLTELKLAAGNSRTRVANTWTCYCHGCTCQSFCFTVVVNKYISQKELLIFCVVPANNDFRNCEANDIRNCEAHRPNCLTIRDPWEYAHRSCRWC